MRKIAGCYDDIERLKEMADEIGYYPNIIFGNYYYDEATGLVHKVMSNCFDNVDFKTANFIVAPDEYRLDEKLKGSKLYEGAEYCPECFGEDSEE